MRKVHFLSSNFLHLKFLERLLTVDYSLNSLRFNNMASLYMSSRAIQITMVSVQVKHRQQSPFSNNSRHNWTLNVMIQKTKDVLFAESTPWNRPSNCEIGKANWNFWLIMDTSSFTSYCFQLVKIVCCYISKQ